MKKISLLAMILLMSLTSCKKVKKDVEVNANIETENFIIKPEATSVKWTAYKTTEKLPVGGEFAVLNFDEKSGKTPQEALDNLSFSIPVSSLFTKDDTRDAKLKESFFGAMIDPDFIKGTINYINNNYVASITMNGITNKLPLDVKINDERRVTLQANMLLKDWNALGALETLNKVCFDLHKGPDGVSKTWDEVAIEVNTFLREK